MVENAESEGDRKMNDARRERVNEAIDLTNQAIEMLESISEEEQDALDNMPENMQDGERGEKMQENIESLDDAASELGNTITTIEEVIL